MLQHAVKKVLLQLITSLEQLTGHQYAQPCQTLSNASIGKHVRHVIELYQCLESGYPDNRVNYENRKRDTLIEKDRDHAVSLIHGIAESIGRPDKELVLESSFDEHANDTVCIATNYHREVVYNLEHTIHHMALIRIGITEVAAIRLSENYGVASSTIKHLQSCAQ
jgi:hypothetical protein